MKYLSLAKEYEKSSIAWFKLEEVVMRGEKERALTMYRLLIHSVAKESLKVQLEADILRIFGDSQAIFCYIKAADLYISAHEVAQAIFLYKIIIALAPHISEYKDKLDLLNHDLQYSYISTNSFTSSAIPSII